SPPPSSSRARSTRRRDGVAWSSASGVSFGTGLPAGATLLGECIHINRASGVVCNKMAGPFGCRGQIGYMMGIPGLRGGDHVGITVPDMGQAHEFLVGVLGCDYVYSLPQMRHDDEWMREHLNVDPRRVVREIRFYRCGFGLNLEVFEYEPH